MCDRLLSAKCHTVKNSCNGVAINFHERLFQQIYVEAVPLKDKSAVSVARGIYEVYCRQGAPVHVISDQECSNEKKDFVH